LCLHSMDRENVTFYVFWIKFVCEWSLVMPIRKGSRATVCVSVAYVFIDVHTCCECVYKVTFSPCGLSCAFSLGCHTR
jgi:hypothetical protein